MQNLQWQYALINLLGSIVTGGLVLITLWLNLSFILLIVIISILALLYFWIQKYKPTLASKNYQYSSLSMILRLILVALIALMSFFIVNYSASHKPIYLILLCTFWIIGCVGKFISDLFMIYREV